jgi:5'-methylthioadenosine phosphorylase
MFAFITGSGFYDLPGFAAETVSTPHGESEVLRGKMKDQEVIILPRHGQGHRSLPHHINHKAHIAALKQLGCDRIVSFSVCGMLKADLPLAQPYLANDLMYPENRLADGSICSFFDKPGEEGRGHLIAENYFNSGIKECIRQFYPEIQDVSYHFSYGPRFNSKAEIASFSQYSDVISQTAGPEVILTNELEIPYALVLFPIDYANGVKQENTSMAELGANMGKSKTSFIEIMEHLLESAPELAFEGFVYRF